MEFALRNAGMADLVAIRAIYRRASLFNTDDRRVLLDHPEVLEFASTAIAEGRTRVAVTARALVVGFISIASGSLFLEIEDLFVDPDWMRRGIARQLVEDMLETARREGITRVEVTANPAALLFYEKLGFRFSRMTTTQFAPAPRLCLELT